MRRTMGAAARLCVLLLIAAWASPAAATPFLDVVDAAITLRPTPTDYANDYVEATGAAGLAVKVKNNGSTGLVLMVRSASATPAIATSDFLVRTLTPPGPGGASLITYTPLAATNLNLWSTGAPQGPFLVVDMDIRVLNLFAYTDAGGAGTTSYTNTLVFTVIEP